MVDVLPKIATDDADAGFNQVLGQARNNDALEWFNQQVETSEQNQNAKKAPTDNTSVQDRMDPESQFFKLDDNEELVELQKNEEGGGFAEKATAVLGDVIKGGTVEALPQVFKGVLSALDEVSQAASSLPGGDPFAGIQLVNPETGEFDIEAIFGTDEVAEALSENPQAFDFGGAISEADTATGKFIKTTSQFLTGFIPAFKGAKVAGLASKGTAGLIGSEMAAGAVADALVFDPYEDRLSTYLNEVPVLKDIVPDYLADTNPDNQSEWEGRLKNAIEGAGLGAFAEALFRSFKYYKAQREAGDNKKKAFTAEEQAARDQLLEANEAEIIQDVTDEEMLPLGDPTSDQLAGVRSLPESNSLALPDAPTMDQMKRFSKKKKVPLSAVRATQNTMDLDAFKKGDHPGDLIEGFGDLPVAVRREDGEFLIFDGHHRIVTALNNGKASMNMHVIDAKDFAPELAGRKPNTKGMSDDELLDALGVEKAVSAEAPIFINHARINAPDDVKDLIQQMADADAKTINAKRGGAKVSNEKMIEAADEEFQSLEDLIGRPPGPMSAPQAIAARRIMTASAEQLMGLATKAANVSATTADLFNFRRAMVVHYAIQAEVIAARTETARALQSWSIFTGSNKQAAGVVCMI